MRAKFDRLKEIVQQLNRYEMLNELLYWDMRTIMPGEGFDAHADVTDYISTESFRLGNSDELFELLRDISEPGEWEALDDNWKFIVTKMREDQERSRRIPEEVFRRMPSPSLRSIPKVHFRLPTTATSLTLILSRENLKIRARSSIRQQIRRSSLILSRARDLLLLP